jgi:hypothetical protein
MVSLIILVCSLPLHRHSHIGFILTFVSSIHNKQSEHQETASLIVPELNLLVEASFVGDESSGSNTDVTVIPSQFKVTKQILVH